MTGGAPAAPAAAQASRAMRGMSLTQRERRAPSAADERTALASEGGCVIKECSHASSVEP